MGGDLVEGHYYYVWFFNHKRPVSCEWTGERFRPARGRVVNDEIDWTREPELIGDLATYEAHVRACEFAA